MHFRIYPGLLIGRGVTFLWGMGQKWRKLWVSVEHTYTLDDILVVKFVFLTCNRDLLPHKLRESIWEFFVDDLVEFLQARE